MIILRKRREKKSSRLCKAHLIFQREYVDELIELSEERIKKSIDIFGFAITINENFSRDEKFELLKNLWRLIYTDDTLDMNEDHLMKKIANTLNMEHSDIIAAKFMVKEEIKMRD